MPTTSGNQINALLVECDSEEALKADVPAAEFFGHMEVWHRSKRPDASE